MYSIKKYDLPILCVYLEIIYLQQIKVDFRQILAPRVLCLNKEVLNLFNKGIIENDGEGVILRNVGSHYDRGKSPLLLKVKVISDCSSTSRFIYLLT